MAADLFLFFRTKFNRKASDAVKTTDTNKGNPVSTKDASAILWVKRKKIGKAANKR